MLSRKFSDGFRLIGLSVGGRGGGRPLGLGTVKKGNFVGFFGLALNGSCLSTCPLKGIGCGPGVDGLGFK